MNNRDSQLHRKISSIIQFNNCRILKSPECGGEHNIPLFCSKEKGNDTEYCNVDLLIIWNNKIKVIIEIEESDIKPTQICGKFLTSALSSYYINELRTDEIGMDDSVLFIQILDTSTLKRETSKFKQMANIEKSIKNIIPINESKINNYKLFFGGISDFNENHEIVDLIKEVLK